MGEERVRGALPARCFDVLLHRQRPDVSGTPPIQIARSRVVQSMLLPPLMVRRECQNSGDESPEMIRALRSKKGTVSAIVEDDEDPNQETAGGDGDRERQPVGDVQ